MQEQLIRLSHLLSEVDDLETASSILHWDQSTYMPAGGAAARGRQLATLSRLAHEKLTDDEVGHLLEALEPWAAEQPYDDDEASLVRVTRRIYDKAVQVPPAFTAELHSHCSQAYDVWTRARPEGDFAQVAPLLEKTVDLSRRLADYFPGYDHIADPLIDFSDYGMKAATVRALFTRLRQELVPLVEAICSQAPADHSCLRQHFPKKEQRALGELLARAIGYDFERGRQDETHHPFMTRFAAGDVRITTRYKDDDLAEGLFSTIHEVGHALYELGVESGFDGLPLGRGTSSGVHESQSRLWENMVGRSRGFWSFFYPCLQAIFPAQLAEVDLDRFYRAINRVERSLIRTEADEVTYNLHVMIRFDLELALLEGSLAVADLPAAWNERYRQDLGVSPEGDGDGVLQDVHWFAGVVGGAFQGYTLGNVLAAQLFEKACEESPGIPADIAAGRFDCLGHWLVQAIYGHGSKFTAPELIERLVGTLSTDAIARYLRAKFGALYEI
mgnify:CR=1 FL=1